MNLSKIKNLIPAPKDGENGTDAASGLFVPAIVWVDADEDGWSLGNQIFNITPSVVVEGIPTQLSESPTILSAPSLVTASYNSTLGVIVISVRDYTDPADYEGEVKVRMVATVGGKIFPVVKSIPVVAKKRGTQGEAGDDGVTYELVPSVSYLKRKNGAVSTGPVTLSAWRYEGKKRIACALGVNLPSQQSDSPYYWVQFSVDGGDWTTCQQVIVNNATAVLGYGVPGAAVQTVTSGLSFRLRYGTGKSSDDICHETAPLQIVDDGVEGKRGKRGRFYYYDGYYVQGKEYEGDDEQAPYVLYEWSDDGVPKVDAYMLVADTNLVDGTYVHPKSDSNIWAYMHSEFKFIISEAVISSFGKFGGAVFSGDFMLSQYGTLEDFDGISVVSEDYKLFDPDVLDEDYSGNDEFVTATYVESGNIVTIYSVSLKKGKLYTLSVEWGQTELPDNGASAVFFLAGSATATTPIQAKETPESTNTGSVSVSVNENSKYSKKQFVAPSTGTFYVRGYRSAGTTERVDVKNCRIARRKFIPQLFFDLRMGFAGMQELSAWTKIPGKTIRWDLLMGNTSESSPNKGNIVIVPPNTTLDSITYVWLDNPVTNKNKMVEIINRGLGTVDVKSVLPAGRSRAFKVDSTSGWGDTDHVKYTSPGTSGTTAERTATSLAVARFWSDGSYWYMLEWRLKNGEFAGINY